MARKISNIDLFITNPIKLHSTCSYKISRHESELQIIFRLTNEMNENDLFASTKELMCNFES